MDLVTGFILNIISGLFVHSITNNNQLSYYPGTIVFVQSDQDQDQDQTFAIVVWVIAILITLFMAFAYVKVYDSIITLVLPWVLAIGLSSGVLMYLTRYKQSSFLNPGLTCIFLSSSFSFLIWRLHNFPEEYRTVFQQISMISINENGWQGFFGEMLRIYLSSPDAVGYFAFQGMGFAFLVLSILVSILVQLYCWWGHRNEFPVWLNNITKWGLKISFVTLFFAYISIIVMVTVFSSSS